MQAILEAHDAQPHRAMLQIGITRFGDSIEIDIDDIVQHAHRYAYGSLELGCVQFAILDVRCEVDRAQIAHGDLVIVGVQRYLGTKIGAMHYPDMVLRRPDIAGVLESNPWMTGFE